MDLHIGMAFWPIMFEGGGDRFWSPHPGIICIIKNKSLPPTHSEVSLLEKKEKKNMYIVLNVLRYVLTCALHVWLSLDSWGFDVTLAEMGQRSSCSCMWTGFCRWCQRDVNTSASKSIYTGIVHTGELCSLVLQRFAVLASLSCLVGGM